MEDVAFESNYAALKLKCDRCIMVFLGASLHSKKSF